MVKKVTEIFDKNGRWLDVGSGTGAPACYLAKLYPNIKVEGINIVKDQIKKSTKLSISKRCENQVNFIFGDALDIPYPENFFQNIYAIESAFHFEDKLKFIKESHRVLSHSGKISIADIVIRKEYLKWSDWYKIFIAKHGLATKEFYDKDKWHETLEQNNFNNIETEDITINVLRLFPKWIKLIQSNKIKLIGLYPKTFLTMFVKCLEYAYNKYDKCPFGYIIIKAEKS